MLELFRKYQSYIYLAVTVVIAISFSLSNTQSTIVLDPVRDQVVFTAIDGENIRRHELDEMVTFISTDNYDKQAFQGAWGPNFLNNGVIRDDLLKTGLGAILATNYLNDLSPDLDSRFQKEKAYKPYQHPQTQFIGQEAAWMGYAPKINENLKTLQTELTANSEKAFNARIGLFLAEMDFPHFYSRYIIESQEKQFNFVTHDRALDEIDLSLFGYHTQEDWFGPRFIRLAGQFIINAAKVAEQKGYEVSKEEALADLLRNSQISYNQNLKNSNISVANSQEYYNQQLRYLGMSQAQVVKTWRQVLLFRRLFKDIGNAVFESPLTFQKFNEYASETIEGDLYTLPKELQFSDYRTLQKFEIYLSQIAKRTGNPLSLPDSFLPVSTVEKRVPGLVQKRYLIKLKEINKKNLFTKVSLKETWNFEISNWNLLKENFPELALKKGETNEERLNALESLDKTTRDRVDLFARKEITEAHPEWLIETLEKAREKVVSVGISKKGYNAIFEGLDDGESLIKELDALEINAKPIRFTANGQNYYLITVIDKSKEDEILTFSEANDTGILDVLLEDKLRLHFQKNKDLKNWVSFEESKNAVTDDYFSPLLKEIAASTKHEENSAPSLLAPLRFYSFMEEKLEQLKLNNSLYSSIEKQETEENKLSLRKSLNEQWQIEKKSSNFVKSKESDKESLFNLPALSWTTILKAPNGDISFFFVKSKGKDIGDNTLLEAVSASRKMLGDQAEKSFMHKLIKEIKDLQAISLQYLNQPVETIESEGLRQQEEFELG